MAFRVRRWSAHRRPRTGSAGISGSIRFHIASVITNRTDTSDQPITLGEVEGLSVSLAAAEEKIAQLDPRQERRNSPTFMGIPTFNQIAARVIDTDDS